jgi:wobble nucleotide-excising tRNase
MIQQIHLRNVATYPSEEPCSLEGFSKVNFIYGTNGTGKTTITRVIDDCSRYAMCSIQWEEEREIDTYVYNEEFVRRNFYEADLPGVFTLGSDSVGVRGAIEEKTAELERAQERSRGLQRSIQAEAEKLSVLNNNYKERCWSERLRYEKEYGLKEAFAGFRNSKEAFLSNLTTILDEEHELLTLDQIKEKAKTVYAEVHEVASTYALLEIEPIQQLDESELLSQEVIGAEGVPIAELITHLSNSDWVKNGRRFLAQSQGTCPFCQTAIDTDALQLDLENFFDETYAQKIREIKDFKRNYAQVSAQIIARLEAILANPTSYVDQEMLASELETIRAKVDLNTRSIDDKILKASEVVELELLAPLVNSVNEKLNLANVEIEKHNAVLRDLENEKETLAKGIWKHIAESLHDEKVALQSACALIDRGIKGRTQGVQRFNKRASVLTREVAALKNQITTTGPTVTAINSMLLQFGFTSFSLANADEGYYKIVRANGDEAKETLSEGEKTFLTFLYFYHSLQGSSNASGADNYKVVVIDDPISSLDSTVLFIISTLVRKLIDEASEGGSSVRQLFLLTHNTYFHKEVSFKYKGNNFTYWIVKKRSGLSEVQKYDTNPVVSMYEMLWKDVKEKNDISIQNSMRRILEYYFKNLGGIHFDELTEHFEGDQKIYCRALVSWLHDGSHSIFDDLQVVLDEQNIVAYKEVFKQIFELKGHGSHYTMMMD